MNVFRNEESKNKLATKLMKLAVVAGVYGAVSFTNTTVIHGLSYLSCPVNRTYKRRNGEQILALAKYGPVIYAPQSMEKIEIHPPLEMFSEEELRDGKLVLTELGQLRKAQQGEELLEKVVIDTKDHGDTGDLIAKYSAKDAKYYITKEGWDPNSELKASDFELIADFAHHHFIPGTNDSQFHNVTIPTDRSGHHLVLSVWEVESTKMAYYQVIYVYAPNDDIELLPPVE